MREKTRRNNEISLCRLLNYHVLDNTHYFGFFRKREVTIKEMNKHKQKFMQSALLHLNASFDRRD